MGRNKQDHQEFFDECTRRMAEQGYVAVTAGGDTCLYTTPEKNHCAIGIMLTPEEQSVVGDYVGSVQRLLENSKFGGKLATLDGYNTQFLMALQSLHDKSNKAQWASHHADYHLNELGKYITVTEEQADVWANLKTPTEQESENVTTN